ncbi:MAG: tetratricopeptide repeat protein [Bacteroidota bacterium]
MPKEHLAPPQHTPHETLGVSGIPPRILWTFTLSLPVLFLVAVEIVLRVLHFGPDLSLFMTGEIAGREYAVMNPGVTLRYFSNMDFNPTTSSDYFPIPKPKGTFRIFCLGGSTTVGFPYGYEGSFPTFLRERLKAIFPDRSIEVINLGMTATNSFTTLDIGRELFSYEPDLLIVYDGHNEFYGALGVASHESVSSSRWMTELYLSLLKFRTFVVLRDVTVWIKSLVKPPSDMTDGTMMERLAKGKEVDRWSPEYMAARRYFAQNLEDLVHLAREHHVPIMFGTQVSNLRDLPPFVSGRSQTLSPASLRRLDRFYSGGDSLSHARHFHDAIQAYDSALALDSTRADLHFDLARALDSLHRFPAARQEYIRARDFDRLRFRTSSDFNDIIMSLSSPPGVVAIDLEHVLAAHSPDSLIGRTLILEHVHPTARGAFLIAKAYANAMDQSGLVSSREDWTRRDTIPDDSLWSRKSLTVLDDLAAAKRITTLTSYWPFHESLSPSIPTSPRDTVLDQFADLMIEGEWTWEHAHEAAGLWYQSQGRFADAAGEYAAIVAQFPFSSSTLLRLAEVSITLKRYDEAEKALERSLDLAPTFAAARMAGSLHMVKGEYAQALALFNRAALMAGNEQEDQEIHNLIDATQRRLNQRPDNVKTH